MIYLLCAIVFGSLFAVVFKICQNRNIDSGVVILLNYIAGAVFGFAPILLSVFSGKAVFSDYSMPVSCILLALVQGFLFWLGFFVMDRSTWRNGIALTTASARASLILPVILSWLIFAQGIPDWLGVALIITAMILIAGPNDFQCHDCSLNKSRSDRARQIKAALALVAVFLTYGISDFFMKVVQNSVTANGAGADVVSNRLSMQTVWIFVGASVSSLVSCIVKGTFSKSGFGLPAVIGGLALGLINIGCTSGILRALNSISTNVFYPLYNIGIVVIGTCVGVFFFKEKVKPIQYCGLALAVAAIALTLLK